VECTFHQSHKQHSASDLHICERLM
jgi:hypothetical protein